MIYDLHATVGLVDVRLPADEGVPVPWDVVVSAAMPGSVRVTTATMATYDIDAVGTISEACREGFIPEYRDEL
jgi:hypothetical protein